MFSVNEGKKVPVSKKDIWSISADYEDLLFDEKPVLYTGKNSEGKRVLGSSVDEDEYAELDLRCLVSDADYEKFLKGEVHYQSLLRKSRRLYLIQTLEFISVIYQINFDDIPAEYQPTDKSFYTGKKGQTYESK